MKRNVLVFGASGEIGGRIARLAVDAGHRVYGVTRGKNTRDTVDLSGVEMLHGDKNDPAFLAQVAGKLPVDAVIDSVPGMESAALYRRYIPQAQNVFYCSSTGTFVPLRYFPADEDHPWRAKTAVNFFDQSERDAGALAMYRDHAFPITIFRPTNIIGAGRVPLELWGARDIRFFQLLKSNQPVTIAPCENILLQSGYNQDLARAFVQALDYPDAVRGEIFIISCRRAVTLGEYLATAMEFLGSHSEIRHIAAEKLVTIYPEVTMPYRMDFLLEHMCFDIGKAERAFGYAPTKTTQEGLIDALTWCCDTGLL